MATASTTTNEYVSNISGCVTADAMVGSNGDANGAPEVLIEHDETDQVAARRMWDSNLADGLDSGWVTVTFTAEAGGGSAGAKWAVMGATTNPLVYTGRAYGNIATVTVRAGTRERGSVEWRSLNVVFHRSGRPTENHSQSTGPAVDTRTGTAIIKEQFVTVTPGLTNNTKVVVTGQIRLMHDANVFPSPADLFAQVILAAADCTEA